MLPSVPSTQPPPNHRQLEVTPAGRLGRSEMQRARLWRRYSASSEETKRPRSWQHSQRRCSEASPGRGECARWKSVNQPIPMACRRSRGELGPIHHPRLPATSTDNQFQREPPQPLSCGGLASMSSHLVLHRIRKSRFAPTTTPLYHQIGYALTAQANTATRSTTSHPFAPIFLIREMLGEDWWRASKWSPLPLPLCRAFRTAFA